MNCLDVMSFWVLHSEKQYFPFVSFLGNGSKITIGILVFENNEINLCQ